MDNLKKILFYFEKAHNSLIVLFFLLTKFKKKTVNSDSSTADVEDI
jgi:hypothetical protein